ncbi:NAD(P)H-hydrate dehydratase [Sanyastnella coralliicola]|uniref:NAD(P)H-hydrate dehydratase n=1 Tax=Sanyastnella coralliicola TaxID=3069118 RepID=UPI0027BA8B71|nr:NAD(P)H-hydrate dehydratase [Longitalea sp. SCSIO 12813]
MKKLFSTDQIRDWDRYTIENEPISSLRLMERASTKAFAILMGLLDDEDITIFCGTGNNGGDGLVLARLLRMAEFEVDVFVLGDPEKGSEDFKTNLEKVGEVQVLANAETDLMEYLDGKVVIDAIFGSGLTRPLEEWRSDIVRSINLYAGRIISLDLPSGLPGDASSWDHDSIWADLTISFQQPKKSFFYEEGDQRSGEIIVADIGLHPDYEEDEPCADFFVDPEYLGDLVVQPFRFIHKGSKGMAQVVGGHHRMFGAIGLTTNAALRSGAGLVVAQVPAQAEMLIHQWHPEAMVIADQGTEFLTRLEIHPKTTALGIGPGMGQDAASLPVLHSALASEIPLVIDADALNLIAAHGLQKELKRVYPTVITPHPTEFDRLFGAHEGKNAIVDREATARAKAQEYQCFIVLKGAFSRIYTPEGECIYNTSGSPALAVGGSGDVLTGLLTGMLAQGFAPVDATMLAVYLHGSAGERFEEMYGTRGMTATDIVDLLPEVFAQFID